MSDMNLDLYLMRCLLAHTACQNTACSAFYIMRKIRLHKLPPVGSLKAMELLIPCPDGQDVGVQITLLITVQSIVQRKVAPGQSNQSFKSLQDPHLPQRSNERALFIAVFAR